MAPVAQSDQLEAATLYRPPDAGPGRENGTDAHTPHTNSAHLPEPMTDISTHWIKADATFRRT